MNINKGFTLVELAIAMAIISLLLGGLLLPLSAQLEQRNLNQTKQMLDDIRESLIGYAASHSDSNGKPYLPCPDTDNDGLENRTNAACVNDDGLLPWRDLATGEYDSWNNPFRYHVSKNFANTNAGFTLTTRNTLSVCEQAQNCDSSNIISKATSVPVVILSYGKNGASTSGGLGADEKENTDKDSSFVSHVPTPASASGGEFDDIVTWIPATLLFSKMLSAGKLP